MRHVLCHTAIAGNIYRVNHGLHVEIPATMWQTVVMQSGV